MCAGLVVAEVVIAYRASNPTELHRKLIDEIGAFTQGAEQNDDLTLLILGYEG